MSSETIVITLDGTTSTTVFRTYDYDALDRLTQTIDRNGRTIGYDYEQSYDGGSNSRMKTETWDNTAGTSIHAITWDYDDDGYLTTVSDAYSGYEYDHDALGRVTSIDNSTTPNIPTVVINHTYDNLGRRTNVETSIGGTADSSTDYTYDVLSRITSIHQTDANTSAGAAVTAKQVDFGYNALGQYDTITRFEGTTGSSFVAQTHYDYDDAHRLEHLVHYEDQTEGTDITSYSWTWDADNRIDSFILGRAGTPDETVTYNYDDTDQLTGETYLVDSGNNETYTYDANGNRTGGTTIQPHNRLTDDGTFTYTYDAEGNRIRKTHKVSGDYTEYTWDNRNRLTAVEIFDVSVSTTTPQETVEYVYDAWDRKIGRKYDSDDAGTAFDESEWYVYDAAGKRDGVTTVPLDDIILVFDGSGSLTTRYLHGPGFDQVLASETVTGGTTIDEVHWTLTDHQGTVRSLISHDGSTVTLELHRTFDAFGNIESVDDTLNLDEFRYAYTGREWDGVTDLQYNRMRWYDPNIGRWISEDPIGFAAGDVNLSRYVGNASGQFLDPSGFADWYWPWHPNASHDLGDTLNLWTGGKAGSGGSAGDFLDQNFDNRKRYGEPGVVGKTVKYTATVGSYLPLAGEVADYGQAICGYDEHGNPLTWSERGLNLAPVPGSWLRGGKKAKQALGSVDDAKTAKRTVENASEGVEETLSDPVTRQMHLDNRNQQYLNRTGQRGEPVNRIGNLTDEQRAMLPEIWSGDRPITDLPAEARVGVANLYRTAGERFPSGTAQCEFNLARWRYLTGTGPNPGPDAPTFGELHNYPMYRRGQD